MAVQINNVITKCLQKLLSFVLVVVTKYKAQIQTEMLKDLRQTSRDTDMLLKQQIAIRCKIEDTLQEQPTKPSTSIKTKEVGVPVKRKFENEVDKPTNIPAQARPKSSAIAAPTL